MMKNFRVLYEVNATGRKGFAKMGSNIQTEDDARKAMQIRYGNAVEIITIVDINEEF